MTDRMVRTFIYLIRCDYRQQGYVKTPSGTGRGTQKKEEPRGRVNAFRQAEICIAVALIKEDHHRQGSRSKGQKHQVAKQAIRLG